MTTNDERDQKGRISKNDPSKPMDSKRDVENSSDEKTDQDFPGYPHYPSTEDIMDKRTDSHRVDVDVEKFAGGQNASGLNQRYTSGQERSNADAKETGNDDEPQDQSGTNSTGSDELDALNSKSEEIGTPQNVSNEDLNKENQ